MLAHLRAVTRPAHEAMEGSLGLMDETLDLDAYRTILARFYGFWVGWEPQVALLLRNEDFIRPRRRLHLLSADLAALGLSKQARAALPRCVIPKLENAKEALGSLYVMEGSTLGGRVIQRHVERRLGEEGRASSRYFTGYGSETGMMWQAFLRLLDTASLADAEGVARGAVVTFERLGQWLNSAGSNTDPGPLRAET